MKSLALARVAAVAILLAVLVAGSLPRSVVSAQSGRQPPKKKVEKKTEEQKSGPPEPMDPQEPVPPVPKNIQSEPPIKISTQVVNVEVTVIDKKSGRLYNTLKQPNFTIYEDGVKQEVTNFRSGEGPMTAVLLIENSYSNRRWQGYYNPTFQQEIFRSAAVFVQRFVKPQDHIALVTYSLKPKVIQDFTGDSGRLQQALLAAYRDGLNFSEACYYDALSFALLGGKAIQLFDEDDGPSEYNGLQEVEGHTAVILITLGIDTFSKLTYDKALKIVKNAGVPVYTIGVGNLFYKKYGDRLPSQSDPFPMAFLQLKTFAEFSGGAYFPMTFEGEIPSIMQSIEAMLRGQYSLGYSPTNTRREGKERKIKVEVDVDGDGVADNKRLDLKFRQRYVEADDNPKKK